MTTDFRALCVELTDCLEKADWPLRYRYVFRQWVDIARAALADEPAVPENRAPTQDELWELWLRLNNELPDRPAAVAEFWEHAQINARACWGNPAPQMPAEGEVAELVDEARYLVRELRDQADDLNPCLELFGLMHQAAVNLARAADLLQRLGPPQPVPVSERLPGPEDCIANPRNGQGQWCWGWCIDDPAVPFSGRWRMLRLPWLADDATHWLPAHALPLPSQEVER